MDESEGIAPTNLPKGLLLCPKAKQKPPPRIFGLRLYYGGYFEKKKFTTQWMGGCSYFGWDLCGIPCVHAVAAILSIRGAPQDYVEEWYTRDKYIATYSLIIPPMPGADDWRRTPYPEPLPPPFKRMPGRPSKKRRKRQPCENEVLDVAARVVGRPNRCSNCKQMGHNKKSCNNAYVDVTKEKGGKPMSMDPWVISQRKMRTAGKGKKKPEVSMWFNIKDPKHQQSLQQMKLELQLR